MLAKVNSYGLQGIHGYAVQVEVDVHNGLPGIEMVGLPDAAIKESKERVKSAIKNSGFLFTPKKITINLAPADTRKEGALYDLPIALGILIATGQARHDFIDKMIFVGEMSLTGQIRSVKGILPILISARDNGFRSAVIPSANRYEASYVEGIDIYTFDHLSEIVSFLSQPEAHACLEKHDFSVQADPRPYAEDFKYIRGQFSAKRALEIAAAGGHNVIMVGPPGGGKTMMAKCLPTILPDMSPSESMETTKIHSVAGALSEDMGIVLSRPFRTPHHTITKISLTGGGSYAKPGEISLAHNGVLFLDELLEYKRETLEILRQPLEDKVISISRALRNVVYPANFMLVASLNPCPCGNYGSSKNECICTPAQIAKYRSKLSGPLMDRIDLHIEVDNVTYDDLASGTEGECSSVIKERVDRARQIQLHRYQASDIFCNANMNSAMMGVYCKLDEGSAQLLKNAFDRLGLSARAYNRILKVARTIADLAGSGDILQQHIGEAIQYRSLDRSFYR